jgi:calcineurin-like phosphoesterase family protein
LPGRRPPPKKAAFALVAGLVLLGVALGCAADTQAEPPRLAVAGVDAAAPLTFVVYGDTRFTERAEVANAFARRTLVEKIALEKPLAVFIGGDLVYEGRDRQDYEAFARETPAWAAQGIPVFPALGNHEFRGCAAEMQQPCLENWWTAFEALHLAPHRWYSVSLGASVLVLLLDSDSALKAHSPQRQWLEQQIDAADGGFPFILLLLHYPPVRDPIFPRGGEEREIARYLAQREPSLRSQVVVVGSHVHNYERFQQHGVTYLVSGGGGAKPVPAFRMFGELSHLRTSTNFHYLRFTLDGDRLTGVMVRFDPAATTQAWTEPDRFEVRARK